MNKGIIIALTGILIIIFVPLMILNSEKTIAVNELCVDNLNGVNLNGVMCKHEYKYYFNLEYDSLLNENIGLIGVMFFIFGFATILIGLGIAMTEYDDKLNKQKQKKNEN